MRKVELNLPDRKRITEEASITEGLSSMIEGYLHEDGFVDDKQSARSIELQAETPARFVRAMREMLSGYDVDVAALLETKFVTQSITEIIVVKDIEFVSVCEHHLLPFYGTMDIAYKPVRDRVYGLSKIPRLVQALSKRLQVQERLGQEIVDELMAGGEARWAQCRISSTHSCMKFRGVECNGSMVTLHGVHADQLSVSRSDIDLFLAMLR